MERKLTLADIANAPQTFTESPQNFTAIPEWKERIREAAGDYLDENGLQINFEEDNYAAGACDGFFAGANFARKVMQQEIDALKRENELLKANLVQSDAMDEAHMVELERLTSKINELNDECGSLGYDVKLLTEERDDLQAELTLERGGSELFKRQRDELIEALRNAQRWINMDGWLPDINILKQYDK